MKKFIDIVDYNSEWPGLFEIEKERIINEIKEYIVSIHHIGSTSVEGLGAKSIIDILIEVNVYPPDKQIIFGLERLEYINMGEAGFERRYWFKKGDPRKNHVHIVQEKSKIIKKAITFRDFLRNNKDKAKEYEALKRKEAKGKVLDNNEYAISKNNFVESILKSANNTAATAARQEGVKD